MARLHSETIPNSTLASTARVVDGFVTTQSDHSGISSSFTRAYTATGITWYTCGWDLTKKAPDGCKGDWTNAQHLPEGRGAEGRLRVNICESARRPRLGRLRQQAVRAIGQTRSVCPEGARSREAAPSQVFGSDGYIKTAYTYTPYGSVTANGNVTQPIQWSSEYNDSELGLVYDNYRHYNPANGRWTGSPLNIH